MSIATTLESVLLKSKILFALAGFLRGLVWFFFGRMNRRGVHLIVYATSTKQVLCVNPTSETYLRLLKGWSYVCHMPGGGVEDGESASEALKREGMEELLVESLDLISAERKNIVVRFGKLRNQIAVFRLNVACPEDFPVRTPRTAEFVSPHEWRSVEEAYRCGNAGMRTALSAFAL